MATLSKRSAVSLVVLLLGTACGSSLDPSAAPLTLEIVPTTIPTDTIETQLRDTLVIALRKGKSPVAGVPIRLLAGGRLYTASRPAFMWILPVPVVGTPLFTSADLNLTTDQRGEIRVIAKRGWYSGKDYLIASIPILGIADSVPFEIQPGVAYQITVSPGDTAILIGAAYRLTTAAVDRVGNPVPSAGTVVTDSSAVTISMGGVISANRLGRANLRVTVAGQERMAGVSVVPEGVIAGALPNRIVVSRTDGADVGWSPTPVPAQPFGLTWMRRADSLAFELNGVIHVADSTGRLSRLFQQQIVLQGEKWPQFFRTEESLLLTSGQSVWRVNLKTLVAENLTSSAFAQDIRASPAPTGGQAVVTRSGQLSIMLLTSHLVTPLGVSGFAGRWAPDESQIAYLDFGQGLSVIRPDGTGARRVQPGGYSIEDFDWSPDGKWLVASNGHPDYGFFLLEVNGPLVLPLPHTKGMRYPAWRR